MIQLIHTYEAQKPKQHMVGLGNRVFPVQPNQELWDSPADYISPTWEPRPWATPRSAFLEDYGENPPKNKGKKVCITDADHLWGHGGNYIWVWKSFCRGLNPSLWIRGSRL